MSPQNLNNDNPIKVCLVGPLPPPEGGIANQTRQLVQKLPQEGVYVELVRTNAPYRPAWIGRVQGIRALARLIPYVMTLIGAIRRCDVVHIMANSGWAWHLFSAPAVWAAVLCRKPAIVNYRGGEAERFLAREQRYILFTLRRVSKIIVPSGFLQSVFAKYATPTEIIPNIVDLARFTPPSERFASRPAHVVVTRNLEPIYDIETAIRAVALLKSKGFPDVRLSIAGEGPLRGNLEQLTKELSLTGTVHFVGRLDRQQIAALYQSAHVVLNPSLVDNMPNSLLEALACGVPIVSTDVGGVPFVVQHGSTALLVPPQDPERMCSALASVMNDSVLARRLSEAGLQYVRQFGWDVVAPQWIRMYSQVRGGGKTRYHMREGIHG